jgi:hypothetical protein
VKRFLVLWVGIGLWFGAGARGETLPSQNRNYSRLDLGAFMSNIDRRLTAPKGYASEVSSVLGFLRFRRGLRLGRGSFFEPSAALVLPWRSDADGGVLIFPIILDANFMLPLSRGIHVRAGFGVYSEAFVGTGSNIYLNNGTGYSTFYSASGLSFSFNLKPELGIEVTLSRRLSLNLDVFSLAVFNGLRRSIQGSASLGITL